MGALTDRIGSASFFMQKKLYREKINNNKIKKIGLFILKSPRQTDKNIFRL